MGAAARFRGNPAQLHRYWVAGPGLAKWSTKPHPWTALRSHLAKYIHDPRLLNSTTSRWHNEILPATGGDAYRVAHGGHMRGKRIGPG